MSLSKEQCAVLYATIQEAQHILDKSDPLASSLSDTVLQQISGLPANFLDPAGPLPPLEMGTISQYTPPLAQALTSNEIAHGDNKVNLQTTVDAIIDHPLNACVEYPETGHKLGVSVGHRMLIDKTTGKAAICKNTKYGCKGIKRCEYAPKQSIVLGRKPATQTAAKEVSGDGRPGFQKHSVTTSQASITNNKTLPRGDDPCVQISMVAHSFNASIGQIPAKALLDADHKVISRFENEAKVAGYGPLIPCTYMASALAQKALCPYWHRFSSSQLRCGIIECCNDKGKKALPHTHIDPFPVKTPPSILTIFSSLLLNMGWRLADATPRNIMLDSGFMNGLKQHLGWTNACLKPVLSDLHPSLGNSDHVQCYINDLRTKQYPRGTGFEGATRGNK
ncbi:hypothetical protein B0H34DRAFT_674626 [Crassisporium funariophilum]|nr:hypothetical protein B0H34DRAFT_674626 [Crassisporium funariophilum]